MTILVLSQASRLRQLRSYTETYGRAIDKINGVSHC